MLTHNLYRQCNVDLLPGIDLSNDADQHLGGGQCLAGEIEGINAE